MNDQKANLRGVVGRILFSYYPCYLLAKDLSVRVDPLPCVPGFCLTINQSDGLISYDAFCEESGELAHTTKVATAADARWDVDELPYKVRFDLGEVCSGKSLTAPKHRRLGLYLYVRSKVFADLADRGFVTDRFSVRKDNEISLHTLQKLGARITAEGRRIKFLRWSVWNENASKY